MLVCAVAFAVVTVTSILDAVGSGDVAAWFTAVLLSSLLVAVAGLLAVSARFEVLLASRDDLDENQRPGPRERPLDTSY